MVFSNLNKKKNKQTQNKHIIICIVISTRDWTPISLAIDEDSTHKTNNYHFKDVHWWFFF